MRLRLAEDSFKIEMAQRKIVGSISELTCSQSQLARALNISQPRVNQLIDEGVVVRDEQSQVGAVMLFESLQNYFLSKNATGDGVNFWKERSLHERAKRELAELKLAKSRGEVYAAGTVESILIELLTNFRNKLLGLPSKYAMRLEGKTRDEIYRALTEALEEELTELSEGVNSSDFNEDGETAISDIEGGSQTD